MIDGIKIMNLEVSEDLRENTLLNFLGHYSVETGEILPFNNNAKYKSVKFSYKPKTNTFGIEGSLHKYFNNGEHNYNDFTLDNIRKTLIDLEGKFHIDGNSKLTNVEFGINLRLDYPPIKFIKSVIIHKNAEFYPMNKSIIKQGTGIECKHDQYYIKIYDKGTQYELSEFVLRIEVKVVKMKYFSDKGIKLKTLNDLKNESIYPLLKKQFITTIKEIVFCDFLKVEDVKMKVREELLISKGQSPNFWLKQKPSEKLKQTDKNEAKKERKRYYTTLDKFNEIAEQYGLLDIKNEVLIKSENKWNELYNTKSSNYKENTDKFTENYRTKSGQIHTIYKVGICTQPEEGKKYCLETGVDISDQKPYSKFVSAKKVGEVIAKRIRNKFNDRRKRVNYLYNQYDDELTLFDMKEDGILKISNKEKGMIA